MSHLSRISRVLSLLCVGLLLQGCGGKGGAVPVDVPPGAQLIADKPGSFAFEAPRAGTAYIVEASSGRTVFQTRLGFQDWLYFNPEKRRIVIRGQIMTRQDLDPDRVHRLYFVGG